MADIEKIWILSCVFFVVIKTYSSTDVQQVELITWSAAAARCSNGLEFRESILLKESDVLKNRKFWLGKAIYRKTSDWMEILGCYEVTDGHVMTFREISSLGECQFMCKSIKSISVKYFGYNIRTNVCICFEKLPTVKYNLNACEANTSATTYFIYQVYTEEVPGEGGHCSVLNCLGGKNRIKAVNCTKTDNNIAGKCGNDTSNKSPPWGETYFNSLHACMSEDLLLLAPLKYCTQDGLQDEGKNSWTNVFREVFECQLTKAEGGNLNPMQCLAGTLVQLNGQWIFNKTKRDCSKGLDWFVCKNVSGETDAAKASSNVYAPSKSSVAFHKSTNTTLSHSFTTSTKVTKRKTSSLSVTLITDTDLKTLPSLSHRTEKYMVRSTQTNERISYTINSTKSSGVNNNGEENNNQIDHSEKGSNSKTIGDVIGGLLGACSVIALLAVLIVCKVRSIGVFKQSSKHDKQESTQMEYSTTVYQDSNNATDKRSTTATTSNETYGLAENSTSVYAVVNKIKTTENINDTYTDAGYGEYDHLHDIQNRRISLQENLYHSHGAPRNEEDQTYDSSDFGKEKTYDGNGVYDQSFSVVEGEYSYSTNKNHDNSNTMGIYDKVS